MEQNPTPQPERKRLYRVRSGRLLTGVIAGIAQYLGMPAMLLRFIVVALTLLSGFWIGVVLYAVLSFVIPEEPFGQAVPAPPIPGTPPVPQEVVSEAPAPPAPEIVVEEPQVIDEPAHDTEASVPSDEPADTTMPSDPDATKPTDA